MKCHGACGNGAMSRISKGVPRGTQLPRSTNSVMELSLSNVLPAPIRGEIYLLGGIPNLMHGRELLNLPREQVVMGLQMALLSFFGNRCELPAKTEDSRDQRSRARVRPSIFCG